MPCTVLAAARAGPTRPPLLAHSMDTAGPSDFRLVRIPPNCDPPHPRPVYRWDERAVPRFAGVGRGPIPAYSDATYWPDGVSCEPLEQIGSIPQTDCLDGTYGYWEAASGIANDHGVSIAESTCSAIFGAELRGSAGGTALLSYMELTRIALERCKSAREAVELMGALAEEHGFAGNSADLMGSAESLAVADTEEAWVMHVLPDDTGTSAIWAAQRVEEGHAAAVANHFVIREMALDHAPGADAFLLSSNARAVAERHGRWRRGDPFDFTAAFSAGEPRQRYYCGRRQWRALSLFAPSLHLPAEYDHLARDGPYPFSVVAEAPLSAERFMRIMRDTYAGTPFDMSAQQPAAGPFGLTDRYDSGAYPRREAAGGGEERLPYFERPIGVHRMSYSYVCEPSRAGLPVVHFAPHTSLTSVYLPVLCRPEESASPSPLACGSVKAIDRAAAYWAFRIVKQNAKGLVWNRCLSIIQQRQQQWEARAAAILDEDDMAVPTRKSEALHGLARDVVADWFEMLDEMLLRFGDGYEYKWDEDGQSESAPLTYPVEWLERVADWEPVETDED